MGGKGSGRRPAVGSAGKHGTVRRYGRGCRCGSCRTAWAAYIRARRHRVGVPRKVRYYQGVVAAERLVPLTPLGLDILKAAQVREGRTTGEIVEHLLRLYGPQLHFEESAA